MNLTNKLLFPLLLIATLFTSACFDDTPAPKSGKEPCVAASECESNQCVQGLCAPTPKKLNDTCVTSSECKSPLVCLADKCANKPADGSVADDGACTEDKECQAPGSTCKNDVCTAPADHSVADKGACSNTKQCSQPGSTCEANKCKAPDDHSVADNGDCSDTVQCHYGSTCDANKCVAAGKHEVGLDGMCSTNDQCKSETCDTTGTHTCKQHPDFGKNCSPSNTNECGAPLVCLGSLCAYEPGDSSVADGGACTADKQCQGASECSTTSHKCGAPAAPVTKVQKGKSCTATSQCDTDLVCLGKMGAQTCQDKPNDGSLKEGAFCSDDKQCETGLACKQATAGGDMVCVKATLAGLGKACSKPSDCASNTCDNFICVPKDNSVDIGDPCTKTSQCKTDTATPVVFCVKFQGAGICSPQCDPSTGCGSGPLKCLSVTTVENNSQNACYPNIVKKGQSCVPTDLCEQGTLCLSSKVCGKPGNSSVNKGEECTGDSKECMSGLTCSTSSYTCE